MRQGSITSAAEGTTQDLTVPVRATAMSILFALSFSHALNDTVQALLPSIYPILKDSFQLSFAQIGLITLTFQSSASLLQPLVGYYTDRRPMPFSLALGMTFSLCGIVMVSLAPNYHMLLIAAALVGTGSSVFHPEASRVAFMAAGKRYGFAQALFQVGGNFGTSLGPLLAAWFIVPYGQHAIMWFGVLALIGIFVLVRVGGWYKRNLSATKKHIAQTIAKAPQIPRRKVIIAISALLLLIFSKYFYLVSLTNYYTFYLINEFGVSVQKSQIFLFVFLFSVAVGTILGGPIGDRFGRKYVIWFSILGTAPFSMALPHVGLTSVAILTVFIGVILASAFSAILVYAQELIPGKVGLIAGLFFGFAFGIGGIAASALGVLADHTSIEFVFHVCAYLPLIGIVAVFLPNIRREQKVV